MAVEAATKISELNKLWPLGTDPRSEGDDHIRLIKQVLLATDGGALSSMKVTVFTSSGTYTKPAGLKLLEVEIMSAGGAGGAGAATGSGQYSTGSGGGAGAWGRQLFPASALAATVAYTLGAPGTGVAGNDGNTGGTSTFFTLSVTGGAGGAGSPAGTSVSAVGRGGGLVTGGYTANQAGRSSIGYGIFASTVLWAGNGADGMFGCGGSGGTNAAGLVGQGLSSGGGGVALTASQSARVGGAGMGGFILFREYF